MGAGELGEGEEPDDGAAAAKGMQAEEEKALEEETS